MMMMLLEDCKAAAAAVEVDLGPARVQHNVTVDASQADGNGPCHSLQCCPDVCRLFFNKSTMFRLCCQQGVHAAAHLGGGQLFHMTKREQPPNDRNTQAL